MHIYVAYSCGWYSINHVIKLGYIIIIVIIFVGCQVCENTYCIPQLKRAQVTQVWSLNFCIMNLSGWQVATMGQLDEKEDSKIFFAPDFQLQMVGHACKDISTCNLGLWSSWWLGCSLMTSTKWRTDEIICLGKQKLLNLQISWCRENHPSACSVMKYVYSLYMHTSEFRHFDQDHPGAGRLQCLALTTEACKCDIT